MIFSEPTILRLDFNNNKVDQETFVEHNKLINQTLYKARQEAKLEYCYYCNEPTAGLCNSHSIPRFCLRRISETGEVYLTNKFIGAQHMDESQGIGKAGTFHLICRNCDNKIFQAYENIDAYEDEPTNKMMAQIAMKNYLQMISKRLNEFSLYLSLQDDSNYPSNFIKHNLQTIRLDLIEYKSSFEKAKRAALRKYSDSYYLCYFQKLDYVVPLAFQGEIPLIVDFDDNVINDIYNMSPNYILQPLHIVIFPLEKTSIVMVFIESNNNRYRSFYKYLRRLPLNEQLSVINYIIFSYSENIFLSKELDEEILQNENFIDACKKTTITASTDPEGDSLSSAISEFSLSKSFDMPCLLHREHCLDS